MGAKQLGFFRSSFFECTLQGINISHLGKRKIIFKMPFWGDMLVPWRVTPSHTDRHNIWRSKFWNLTSLFILRKTLFMEQGHFLKYIQNLAKTCVPSHLSIDFALMRLSPTSLTYHVRGALGLLPTPTAFTRDEYPLPRAPFWPLFLKVKKSPQDKAFSDQSEGHLGSR